MRIGLGLAMAALFLLAACGQPAKHNDGNTAPSGTHAANADSLEGAFSNNAAMFETFIIRASEIAQANGQSEAVKTYAATAINEHRATLQQLTAAAHAAGIATPDVALDENYQAYLNMLRQQSPQTFDTTFASQLTIAYVSASGQYDSFVASAADSPLRTWAQSQTERLHDGIAAAHALAAGTSDQ